jgi:hypothetical protein
MNVIWIVSGIATFGAITKWMTWSHEHALTTLGPAAVMDTAESSGKSRAAAIQLTNRAAWGL